MNESWFVIIEQPFAMFLLTVGMFGIGLGSTPQNFISVLDHKRSFAVTVFTQWVFTPALAYLLAKSSLLSDEMAIGVLIYAASPSGAFSNLYTMICKGNVALSIALSLFFNILIFATAPFFISIFFEGTQELLFTEVFRNLMLFLVAPVIVGMLLRKYLNDDKALKISESAIRISKFMLFTYVGLSLFSGRVEIFKFGFFPPFFLFIFTILPFYCCLLFHIAMGAEWPETIASSIEVTMKNGAAAILIAATVSGSGTILYSIYICSGISLIFGLLVLGSLKKGWVIERFKKYSG